MKKTLLLTFLFISLISQSQTMRLDSIAGDNIYLLFNYNANNVNVGADIFQKNNDGITWDKISENILSYNTDNLVSVEIVKDWNGSSFINEDKYEYTYNTNLSIDKIEKFNWNTNTNIWVLSVTNEYTYNNSLIDFVTEIYANDPVNNKFKKQYVYSNSTLIRIDQYKWSNQWHTNPWEKAEFSYDGNENTISEIEYLDFDEDGVWESGDYQIYFTYDITITNLIMPNMSASFLPKSNNMITSFSTDNNTYDYFYTDISTANITEYENSVSAYPNPTNNQIMFDIDEFDNIEIYNINGKLISKTNFKIINMVTFPNGIYFYKINKGNEVINGKIIKQ